jgi:hypothetical protein
MSKINVCRKWAPRMQCLTDVFGKKSAFSLDFCWVDVDLEPYI